MREIKLGLETESLHLFFQHRGLDLFKFADITADLGLDGVQINIIPDLNLNQRFGTLQSNDEDYLKRLNDKILSLNLYCEIDTRWTDYELLKEDIKIAKSLGASRIRSYLKPQDNQISNSDFLKSIDDIKRICELLERYDVELALENHEYESSDDLLYIMQKVGSKRLGVLYDTGNSMMVRRDPIKEARKLLPYIKMVHFKDHLVCLDKDEPVVSGAVLGEGSIDIKEMFNLLVEHTDANINLETCYPYSATFKDPAVIQARQKGAKITKELLENLELSSISYDELDLDDFANKKPSKHFKFEGVFAIKPAPLPDYIKPMQYYYPHDVSQTALEELLEFQLECVKKSANRLISLKDKFYKRSGYEK